MNQIVMNKGLPTVPSDVEAERWQGKYWVVQALLGVSPMHPQWSEVNKTALVGYKDVSHVGRMPHYTYGRFWNDVLAWTNLEDARNGFAVLKQNQQTHRIRLTEVRVLHEELVLVATGPDYTVNKK